MVGARSLTAVSAMAMLGWILPGAIHAQTLSPSADHEVVHGVATGQTLVSPVSIAAAHGHSGMLPSLQGASKPQHAGPAGAPPRTPELPGSGAGAIGGGLPHPPAAHIQSDAVVPPDGFQFIDDTDQFPWSTQCKLYITFGDGTTLERSGTIIHPGYVLTAGECVYDPRFGGWASTIEVVPGLDGGYWPYGHAFSVVMRTYTGWTRYQYLDDDFALLTLDRPIGDDTGWLGYAYIPSSLGLPANISGYPLDVDHGEGQWLSYGRVWRQYDTHLKVPTYSDSAGLIGAAIYELTSDGDRYAFGVYVGGTDATRIDSDKFDSIAGWIDSGS